jgi:hypothetical protein
MVSHEKIVLGLERYIQLVRRGKMLATEMFEMESLFQRSPNERPYYSLGRERYGEAVWVGDKIPSLYRGYEGLEANFPGAEILFLLRNIIDVAASYEKQKSKLPDNWNRNYQTAVEEWGQSIDSTLAFVRKQPRNTRIHIVSYEDFFLESGCAQPLFDTLELEMTEKVKAECDRLFQVSRTIEQGRKGDALTSAYRQYIALNAPFDAYRRLFEKRLLFPVDTRD